MINRMRDEYIIIKILFLTSLFAIFFQAASGYDNGLTFCNGIPPKDGYRWHHVATPSGCDFHEGMTLKNFCDYEDIDECQNDPSPCDVNAKCNNTNGSYTCSCLGGFIGNGFECIDIDECQSDPSPCDVNARCSNTEGSYLCTCLPFYTGTGLECFEADCECLLWTDNHLVTFDNVGYTFDTSCMTDGVLVMSNNVYQGIYQFILIGTFDSIDGTPHLQSIRLSFTDGVSFVHEIDSNGILSVDGVQMSANYHTNRFFLMSVIDKFVVVTTYFGLSIHWNLGSQISIKLSSDWRGDRAVGLCGTCNNNQLDEMTTTDITQYGDNWIPTECLIDVNDVSFCQDEIQAHAQCNILTKPNGPFANCHGFIPPGDHYETCIYDYCQSSIYLCDSIASYATQCREAGGNHDNWRDEVSGCSIACSSKSSYSPCTPAWPISCDFPDGGNNSLHNCVEGCVCHSEFVSKNRRCVKPKKCPCFVSEFGIIRDGNAVTNDMCTKQCRCENQHVVCDNNYRCGEHAFCGERNGVHQCHCEDGYRVKGDNQRCVPEKHLDCYDVMLAGHTTDGIYTIYPVDWATDGLEVYCDMTTNGGGWIVFQRREGNTFDFVRSWDEYKYGFGLITEQFWLGNEALHFITRQKDYSLLMDVVKRNDREVSFVNYELFTVASEENKYQIHVEGFSSSLFLNDFFSLHSGYNFSTFDQDNDQVEKYNCAQDAMGGWWYIDSLGCFWTDLNGRYDIAFAWYITPLVRSEMKIRPNY